ncbi:PEP-CTERM sorting domain-containing protein [Leptolyngbya sp. GGD]|uniref:PEP-CTERM sorting domain-containing protein n=1 Tax=Leptolyngbya sp. GGD TaxID=2997907 RepID=UPI00227BDEBD|nr:PEP-CTERM sorting domain-containing protein [Leptolyngbya sp. GGD]MCY6494609.1 PEP-CTERM sorting domain-containing protein [Leptolyngbya sp. GGD]
MGKDELEQRAIDSGLPKSDTSNAFERFSIRDSLKVPYNTGPTARSFYSPAKAIINAAKGSPKRTSVIPDGIATLQVRPYVIVNGVTIFTTPIPLEFPESAFFDAKASDGELKLTGDYQLLGFVDALRLSPAGLQHFVNPVAPIPRLYLATTAGAKVQQRLVDFASGMSVRMSAARDLNFQFGGPPVGVFQTIVCDRLSEGRGTLGVDDLIMGRGVPLNPEIYYNDRFLPIDFIAPQGEPGTLNPLPPLSSPSPPNPLVFIGWKLVNCVDSVGHPNYPNYNGSPDFGYGCDLEPEFTYLLPDEYPTARVASALSDDNDSFNSQTVSVPEPSAMGTFLAVGVWGGVSWRKRKQHSDSTASDV